MQWYENNLKKILDDELEKIENYTGKPVEIENKEQVGNYLIEYISMMRKIIPINSKFEIHISKDIKDKINNGSLKQDIIDSYNEILEKIKKGEDVNCYLSKKCFSPKDDLLGNWGINHLHLNLNKNGNYFSERSDKLLTFRKHEGGIYLIDIYEHFHGSDWADEELFFSLERNFPEIIKKYRISWASKVSPNYSKEERSEVIKNITTFTRGAKGDIYIPTGMGQNAAGLSQEATDYTNFLLNTISVYSKLYLDNPENTKNLLIQNNITPPNEISFELFIDKNGFFYMKEKSTEYRIYMQYHVDNKNKILQLPLFKYS